MDLLSQYWDSVMHPEAGTEEVPDNESECEKSEGGSKSEVPQKQKEKYIGSDDGDLQEDGEEEEGMEWMDETTEETDSNSEGSGNSEDQSSEDNEIIFAERLAKTIKKVRKRRRKRRNQKAVKEEGSGEEDRRGILQEEESMSEEDVKSGEYEKRKDTGNYEEEWKKQGRREGGKSKVWRDEEGNERGKSYRDVLVRVLGFRV